MSLLSRLFGWDRYKEKLEFWVKVTLIAYVDSINAQTVEEFKDKLKAWIRKFQF